MSNSSTANSKKSIVYLTSRFPYPHEKGDKLRAYHQIKGLAEEFEVHLIALSDKNIAPTSITKLDEICSSVHIFHLNAFSRFFHMLLCLINGKPFQTGYFFNHRISQKINTLIEKIQPKFIFTQLIRVSEYVKNIHHIPKAIDYMDALSKGMQRRANKAPWYSSWLYRNEEQRLRNYESSIFDYFNLHFIISDQDKNFIIHPESKNIVTLPNGVDDSFFGKRDLPQKYTFGFIGNMSYPPNIEAAKYIATEIVNELAPKMENYQILIAGANPPHSIKKLSEKNKQLTVSGWVDDIRDAYKSCRLFVAPMVLGTGLQNKILEAMASGVPCLTTSMTNNAIGAKNNHEIIICNTPEQFAESIIELQDNQDLYKTIHSNAIKFVQQNYSWQKMNSQLIGIIQEEIRSSASHFA